MLKNIDNYRFEDLFDLSEIQKLIDSMSKALNMGLVIVSPEGNWITKPSSKCYFCEQLIKTSKKGYENCKISDAALGRPNKGGPIIQKCLSAGLMDAGYPKEKIFVEHDLKAALKTVENIRTGDKQKIVLLENDLPDNF